MATKLTPRDLNKRELYRRRIGAGGGDELRRMASHIARRTNRLMKNSSAGRLLEKSRVQANCLEMEQAQRKARNKLKKLVDDIAADLS